MKKLIVVIALLLSASRIPAQGTGGQTSNGGNILATSANCTVAQSCVLLATVPPTTTSISVTVSGNLTGTLIAEVSTDGGFTWSTAPGSFNQTGLSVLPISAVTSFRVRCSAFTSGNAGVQIVTAGNQINVNVSGGGGSGIQFVSSLPATCTPGVTANVQLSAAITGYQAGTEFWCSATNVWSPSGTIINPGIFNTTTTVTTWSSPNAFVTGTPPSGTVQQCVQNVQNGFAGTGFTDTDALDGCIFIPSSGVTNGASVGVQGSAYNNNSTNAGQFGFSAAVGIGGFAFCNATAGAVQPRCFGASLGSTSAIGATGAYLAGAEADIQSNNNTDTGSGFLASMRGGAITTGNNMKAFWVQSTQTNKWTSGFFCDDGSVAISAVTDPFGCVVIGDSNDGAHDSNSIVFHGGGTAGNTNKAGIANVSDNYLQVTARSIIAGRGAATGTGTDESFGINGKATATLAAGVLVKIDTANADSFVICTTTDTVCHGVTTGGTNFCGVGSTGCGITTVPGSKVELTLGTGTCSIGNFVIVDTTTNGRIKCTAVQPGVGTWIGIAMSAQATVGNAVDVLTKFQ